MISGYSRRHAQHIRIRTYVQTTSYVRTARVRSSWSAIHFLMLAFAVPKGSYGRRNIFRMTSVSHTPCIPVSNGDAEGRSIIFAKVFRLRLSHVSRARPLISKVGGWLQHGRLQQRVLISQAWGGMGGCEKKRVSDEYLLTKTGIIFAQHVSFTFP